VTALPQADWPRGAPCSHKDRAATIADVSAFIERSTPLAGNNGSHRRLTRWQNLQARMAAIDQ